MEPKRRLSHMFEASRGSCPRRNRKIATFVLAIATTTLVACEGSAYESVESEEREVEAFTAIDVSDGLTLNLVVDEAGETEVLAIYDRELLEQIVTEVDGDILVLRVEGPFDLTGPRRIVEVTVSSLDALKVSGGATVSGSGTADAFSLEADGGSDIDLSLFEVRRADLGLSGGAQVQLSVAEQATGSVTGGASVEFLGHPDTKELTVNGGGQIDEG